MPDSGLVEHVQLTAADLLLRPWRDEDAPAVRDALRDPAIAQWNPQGGDPIDDEVALLWFAAGPTGPPVAMSRWR